MVLTGALCYGRAMITRRSELRLLACVAAGLIAAPAVAETTTEGTVVRLSPGQAEQAIESGAAAAAVPHDALASIEDGPRRAIHGEVGMMIGTGGARGMFGTAAIPLGDNAGAIVSFSTERYGGRGYRYRR